MIERQPNTEYILSLSYGKDSIACLEAIKQLNYPLDRIVHAEVWATDTIPADLPPMVEFKQYADQIILNRYGIQVEHVCATRAVERERERERVTYESVFYTRTKSGKYEGEPYGFPLNRGAWCNSRLKVNVLNSIGKTNIREDVLSRPQEEGKKGGRFGIEDPQGFPVQTAPWCNSRLKTDSLRVSNINRERKLVYGAQTEGFLKAPLHKGQIKILCSI